MKMQCRKARKNISLALDSRLRTQAMDQLKAHLDVCPACQDWQREQVWLLELLKIPRALKQTPSDFNDMLQRKINRCHGRTEFFTFSPFASRPALLRAAMFLILIFSTLFGFFLSGRLDAGATDSAAAVFSRTVNLDAFADLPAESFGAVYERLLQGERQ